MAVEVFAAALSAPTAPCAARPNLERGKPLQPLLLNVRVPARGVSSPKPRPSSRQLRRHACRASPRDKSLPGDLGEFDLAQYVEAKVDSVKKTADYGHVIFLRLLEEQCSSLLPVYIGDFETSALVAEINKQNAGHSSTRPMTHDLMKNSLAVLGFRVTKVRITALVDRTYHARVHYAAAGTAGGELDVDARPSDAINLCLRFDAPIYIARAVASQMARPASEFQVKETVPEIEKSCRADLAHFPDPTVQLQLRLQLAITAERYSEAARIRNQIDNVLASDRALSLVVAIETALEDKRFEEARRLRDELRHLRVSRLVVAQKEPEKQDA